MRQKGAKEPNVRQKGAKMETKMHPKCAKGAKGPPKYNIPEKGHAKS